MTDNVPRRAAAESRPFYFRFVEAELEINVRAAAYAASISVAEWIRDACRLKLVVDAEHAKRRTG